MVYVDPIAVIQWFKEHVIEENEVVPMVTEDAPRAIKTDPTTQHNGVSKRQSVSKSANGKTVPVSRPLPGRELL